MGIISTIKAVKTVTKTVKTAKFVAAAGGTIVSEVNKGIKGAKASNRMDELESFAFELICEKRSAPYIDGARLFDSTKQINMMIEAYYVKDLRHLTVSAVNSGEIIFRIDEKGYHYNWHGEPEYTRFLFTSDNVKGKELELKFGGTFWKYSLPDIGLQATETSTGYKVVDSNKQIVAETVGKIRSDDSVLVYIKDERDFNKRLGMLFSPIFFTAVMAPDNLSTVRRKK